MTLGKRIKQARRKKGLTQSQLGALINKTESTIQKYEANTTEPPLNVLYKISDILEVTPDYLTFGTTGDTENDKFIKQSIDSYKHQPVDIIIKLLEYNNIHYELIESDRPEDIQIKITMPITKESAILNYLDIANINTQTMYYFLRALDNKIKEYQEKNKN